MKTPVLIAVFGAGILLTACSGIPKESRVNCDNTLDTAWQELDIAKAEGFAGTVSYTKALSLITSAKTMQTVEKFEACTRQANKARFYIAESRVGR